MLAQKRPAETALVAVPQNVKRTRNDEVQTYKDKQLLAAGVNRVSNLHSPIMKLEGHEADIFTCEFHPDGDYLGKIMILCVISSLNSSFVFSELRLRSENLSLECLW